MCFSCVYLFFHIFASVAIYIINLYTYYYEVFFSEPNIDDEPENVWTLTSYNQNFQEKYPFWVTHHVTTVF